MSLYYGHSPFYPHPEPIQNIYKAFAWLKENAEEYNIDTDAIFVGGESAGAHLSAMAGAIATNPAYNARFDLDERSRHQKIAGLVLNCGVFDLEKAIGLPFRNIELYVQSYCGGKPFDELTEEEKRKFRRYTTSRKTSLPPLPYPPNTTRWRCSRSTSWKSCTNWA